MRLTYRNAVKKDAALLIAIYNAAFHDDYIRYGECPAYGRTKEQMECSIASYPKYIVMEKDIPIGVISFEAKGEGRYYLGCFCVLPAYQGRGIGTQVFAHLSAVLSDWKQITLVTPADKKENIQFYTEKCGFHAGEKQMDGAVEVVSLHLER